MNTTTEPQLCTPRQPTAAHETPDARRRYADHARAVGIAEAVELIVANRPAAALRRITQVVEAELAIEGYAGIRLDISTRMAAIGRDKHAARAGAR